ncbi:hypothetical protein BDZ89DRAFT_1058681 [Hymenopellis radicata]|nr:hypothetical protein BDZ89DRAFT_1058681 [Hymenopellis radicata]
MDFSAPSPSESTSGSSSGFDSNDPLDLNLILQEDMIQDSPVSTDWSQLSSIWQEFPDFQSMDFSNSPMVVDPSMLSKPSIEPNSLSKPHYDYDFPFTFQLQSTSSLSSSDTSSFPRRLSVSSGSGSISSSSESFTDPAAELAQRVREFAGVMMALPTNGALSSSSSSISSAASTPPPTTPPSSELSGQTTLATSEIPNTGASTMMMSSRPKTSHTTIERRYRTNLNARIQSLRMAVPALRVLEWNDGSKKSKGTKAKIKAEEGMDTIDERGFVDGVKVARKCSKANVLGKAVEYISVLKKRELRLRREQDGLKALLSGLVGGPALLNAWEREWKDKFGGEEKDEVDGMDEDGADSDDDDNDEEEERKRKKPKVSPPPPPRKRGRPRKVVPPPTMPEPVSPPTIAPQSQAPQYLLATFALFSFFNNPLTSSPSPSSVTHEGVVLGAKPHTTVNSYQTFIQAFHLVVSLLVFASILWPWFGKFSSRVKADSFRHVKREPTNTPVKITRTASLSTALQISNRGKQGETEKLRKALGWGCKGDSFEEKGLEQRAWVRLGEICIFNPDQTSFASRLFTIYHLRAHLPWFSASAGDLTTLAMLLCPLAKGRAASIWEAARNNGLTQGRACAYERLVLASVGVEEAAAIVKANRVHREPRHTPIGVVASSLLLQRLKKHSALMFVGSVVPLQLDANNDKEEEARRVTVDSARSLGGRMAQLGDAFEQVWNGGHVDIDNSAFSDGLESDIWTLLSAIVMYRRIFPSAVLGSGAEGVSILLSPPPSPTLADHEFGGYKLRTIMGGKVFDDEEIEEARDRVVDMLVALERRGRAC